MSYHLGVSLSSRQILLVGIMIRLLLMPLFAHPFDMFAWYKFAIDTLDRGMTLSLFGLWNFWLILVAYVYEWLRNVMHVSPILIADLPSNFNPSYGITVVPDSIFIILIKIPLIIADVLSAVLIYRISYFYSKNHSTSRRSMILYFFSPIVIWISAAWGQYDSLAIFFTLLSFYLFLIQKNIWLSSISLYLAFLIKIYPLVAIIPMIVSVLRFDKDRRIKLASMLIPLIPTGIYLYIFQGNEIFSYIYGFIFPNDFFFTSGFGLTYWSIFLITNVNVFWSRLMMNLMILILGSLSLYYISVRTYDSFSTVIIGSLLLSIAFFLSIPIVSEQRSLLLLALLSLISSCYTQFKNFPTLLSIFAFFYAQKNFPFYLLPVASRFPDIFVVFFSFASQFINRSSNFISPTFISGLVLFLIGTSFSGILFVLFYQFFRMGKMLKS